MKTVMKLKNIRYWLYNHDVDHLGDTAWSLPHEIDGWVELIDSENSSQHIICFQVENDFYMKIRDEQKKPTNLVHAHDVTGQKPWSLLIGENIDISFDSNSPTQWISVYDKLTRVYLCSFENGSWGGDQIWISNALPTV